MYSLLLVCAKLHKKCPDIRLKNCFVYELQKKETWLSYRNAYKEFITIY